MSFARIGRVRRILGSDAPSLHKPAKRVDPSELRDPLFAQLVDDMFATVAAERLIGMAAPQIGVNKRLFVVHFVEDGETYGPLVMINPKIELREGSTQSIEGSPCIPGMVAEIERATHVICSGLDLQGRKFASDASGLLAICIQHEIDHLDGILISDRALRMEPITDERRIGGLDDAEARQGADLDAKPGLRGF